MSQAGGLRTNAGRKAVNTLAAVSRCSRCLLWSGSATCQALGLRQVHVCVAHQPHAHGGVLDDAVAHAAQAVGDEQLAGGPAGSVGQVQGDIVSAEQQRHCSSNSWRAPPAVAATHSDMHMAGGPSGAGAGAGSGPAHSHGRTCLV